jgi:glycosyltransferase involved in cell wall biosynthesis
MKKIKVLHVINSLGDGGAEGVLTRLVLDTKKYFDHEIVLLTKGDKYKKYLQRNNIKIHSFDLKKNIFEILNLYFLFRSKKNYIVQTWLYHSDFIGGILAKLSGNTKIIWNLRTAEINFSDYKYTTTIIIIMNILLSYVIPKKIIVCSKKSIKIHGRFGFNRKKFYYIPNGFLKKKIDLKNLKQKLEIKKNTFVVGNVARFHKVKNHLYLLKIFKKLTINNNLKLLLVGTNINYKNKKLVNMIHDLKLENNVVLLDKQKKINDFYNIFDLFLLTSKSEGFPNVLAEAMLNRNICFSTDCGDAKYILSSSKFILPQSNSKKAALIINKFFQCNQGKKTIVYGKKNEQRILKEFSLEKMSKKYHNTWIKVFRLK